MRYTISHKGSAVFINAEAKDEKTVETMCKRLIGVVKDMNRFKPEATIEYKGCEFDVEYEWHNATHGDQVTNERIYTVNKIGINGMLISEEAAQALRPTVFEDLSEVLTEYMNKN